MAEVRTQRVTKELHVNFMRKAEECEALMHIALEKEMHNAATILAVHCAISAADALTAYFLGVRHTGTNHADVQRLLTQIKDKEMPQKVRHLAMLLAVKGFAEYEERLVTPANAKEAVMHAGRFLAWTKEKLRTK